LQARKDLHVGQTVRFMGWRDGQIPTGPGHREEGHATEPKSGSSSLVIAR
jgi:hypothetical protein